MIATILDRTTEPTATFTSEECIYCPVIELTSHMVLVEEENGGAWACQECAAEINQ